MRKIQENILAKSLQILFEESTDFIGISYVTTNGKLYLNPAFRKVLGIGKSEDISLLTAVDIYPEWACSIILKEGFPTAIKKGVWRGKVAIKNRKGKEIPISQKIIAHKNQKGEVEFFSTIARDIEEFRQKELTSKLYEKALFEFIPDSLVITDQNFLTQVWNKQSENLYGWKAKDVLRKNIGLVIPSDNSQVHKENVIHTLQTKGKWKGEVVQQRKNGEKITVSIAMAAIRSAGKKVIGYVAINRDITESKRAEKRKDDFIYMASHELKTPLTSFKVYIHILQKKLQEQKDTKTLGFVQKMAIQLTKLTNLVEELLDATRIYKSNLKFRKQSFSINELIKEVSSDFQPISKQKIVLRQQTNQSIYADKTRIRQVLTNLLSNAAKYSSENSNIIVGSKQKGKKVQISVQDFGIGIPASKQIKIFERFYQVTEHATYPGLGLGLYISSQIIKDHKGSIWVKSEVGEGSTFYFTLPTE